VEGKFSAPRSLPSALSVELVGILGLITQTSLPQVHWNAESLTHGTITADSVREDFA